MQSQTLNTLSAADQRIRQLGDTMFELNAQGECTRALLRAEGFSNHELDTYGDAARAHANSKFVRHDEGFTKSDEEWVQIGLDAAIGAVGDAQIATAALGARIPSTVLGRIWPRLMVKLASHIARLPAPQVA